MNELLSHSPPPPAEVVHCRFLEVLPRLLAHGRRYFRMVRCPDRREDCLCEMLALGWKWFLRLTHRGRAPWRFPCALARFAARAVASGRRLTGQERAGDVLSPLAQKRHGFRVEGLPPDRTSAGGPLQDALGDNCRTPPDEQAAFRLDWPCWLRTRTQRDREMIEDLMLGERTCDVANKYGLSPARISQLRQEYKEDWLRFVDELTNRETA